MKKSQLLNLYFLMLLVGFQLTYLFLLISIAEKEITRPLAMSTYQLGWIIVPIASAIFLFMFISIKNRLFSTSSLYFQILLAANLLSSSIGLFSWKSLTTAGSVILFICAQLLGFLGILVFSKKGYGEHQGRLTNIVSQSTLLFFLTGFFAIFLRSYQIQISTVAIYCYGIFACSLILYGFQSLVNKSSLKFIIDLIVVIVIVLLVFDPRFFFNDFARHHQNFFLGPANDVLHGKDVLINSYSQYGLFMPYVLAFIFRFHIVPMTYQGFTLFVSALYGLYYLLIYYMLRKIIHSQWLAILSIAVILYFNYLAVWWGFMPIVPAQGPFRYIWPYIILAAEVMKNQPQLSKRREKFLDIVELTTTGLAAIWSVEVFIYTLLTLVACQLYRNLALDIPLRAKLKPFLRQVGYALLASLIFGILFLALLIIRSHQIPEFSELVNYLRFLTTYSYTTFLEEKVIPTPEYIQRFWIIGPGTFFGSLIGCIFNLFARNNYFEKKAITPIAGLTVFAVLQFSYFFVFPGDLHFALVCPPVIILAGFWLSELLHVNFPFHLKTSVSFGYILLVSFLMVLYAPFFTENRFSHSGLQYLSEYISKTFENQPRSDNIAKRFLVYHAWNSETLEAERLVNLYFKNQREIAIFIAPEDQVETLTRVGKTHVYPISDPTLVEVVPEIEARVMAFPVKFQKGDRILVSNDRSKISRLEQELLIKINQDYYLFPILISTNYTIYEVG